MTPTAFIAAYLPTATQVKAGTGLDETTLLAQWAQETGRLLNPEPGWAGAPNNLANIRCGPSSFCHYASLADFAQAAVDTFHNGFYNNVLATAGQRIEVQIAALGASPWSSSHYGNPPGSLLIPYAQELDMFSDQDRQMLQTLYNAYNAGPAGFKPGPGTWHDYVVHSRDHFDTQLAAILTVVNNISHTGVQVDLTPALQAIAALQTTVNATKTDVDAIKVKTDKDLA